MSTISLKVSPERLNKLYTAARSTPNDLREKGGMVSIHNDYRKEGKTWTFWQMTFPIGPEQRGPVHGKSLIALIGEGETDVVALDMIRAQYAELTDHYHHAPACPANHYEGTRAPTGPCSCGAVEMQAKPEDL